MNKMFGLVGELIKEMRGRGDHFDSIPLGERFMILRYVGDSIAYEICVHFPNFPPKITERGEKWYSAYLDKGYYKIIGNVFDNPGLLKSTGKIHKNVSIAKRLSSIE